MKKILAIFFLLVGQLAVAQDPYYYLIDKSKGLPSNSVYDVFQDKTGYMWFATDEGICRYDGAKFVTYYSEQQTSRAGSCISQDKYGRIWYSNFDGYLYYIEQGKLKPLRNIKPRGYFRYGIANDFLYVVTERGVAIYSLKNFQVIAEIYLNDKTLSAANMINDKFYILGDFLYEISEGKLLRKLSFPQNIKQSSIHPVIIQSSPKGIYFVSKNTKYIHLLSSNGSIKSMERDEEINFVQNSAYTNDGLWLCTPKGAYLNRFGPNFKNYFAAHNISYVFKDNRHNYWFSTLNKGLILVPNFNNQLIPMPARPVRVKSFREKLIISTENDALYHMDLNGSAPIQFHKGNSNHAINQLYVDTLNGNIIFSSNTFNTINKLEKKIDRAQIAIKEVDKVDDKYYSFAASGSYGIFKLNDSPGVSKWDTLFNAQPKGHVYGLEQASLKFYVNAKSTAYNPVNQTIYFATNLGLYRLSLQSQSEIKFTSQSLFIKNLINFNDLTYALSTSGKLYQISRANKIHLVSLSDEYVINGAYRISKSHFLMFIYANSGIFCYNTLNQQLFKVSSSYQDFEVSDVVEANGKFFMATSKGILVEPKENKSKTFEKTFVISNVLVNNQILDKKSLSELSYYQNNIEIKYALLAYSPKEKSNICYKLNNDKWQLLTEQSGSLKLSSLSSGNYRVLFKVGNEQNAQSVSFAIGRPFWFSFWFIALLSLLILIAIYLLYRYKIEQNNKNNQQKLDRLSLENSLNQSKLKAIKSQMNPHFFYNALNTIQSYILANEKKQAVNYLSKFANLTRTILDMSEKEEVSLAEEIKTIGFYLDIEKVRFDGDFEYMITELGIDTREDIRIPSMLLQPYLENAIKHGLLHKEGAKELRVVFKKEVDKLMVTIEDNGIGRKKSMELNEIKQLKHRSFATAAMQSRIELLNKNKRNKISVKYLDKVGENQQGVGTVVIIKLPLNED